MTPEKIGFVGLVKHSVLLPNNSSEDVYVFFFTGVHGCSRLFTLSAVFHGVQGGSRRLWWFPTSMINSKAVRIDTKEPH